MPETNPLVSAIEAPPIMEAHGWVPRYAGAHGPMLDLCQAVPGYAPHPELLEKAAEAARDPLNAKYGPINGDLALREMHAADLSQTYGGTVSPAEVSITSGCNQAFFLAMLTLARAGDAVMLPAPWFWNHKQTCDMLGLRAVALPCHGDNHFIPDPADAEALLTPDVRAIVLVTPNNPTGAVYPPATIQAFAGLCRRRGITLILDETYRDFLPGGQDRAHDVLADPDWSSHTVQIYSFSKAYCIPGHRLGAITASEALTKQFTKVLDCMHICPQRPAQAALVWAIPNLRDWRLANRATINDRAAAMRDAFQKLPRWHVESLGAYFAYVRHPYQRTPAVLVAERMMTEFGALCLPGSAFGPGQEQHVRLAFANTDLTGIGSLANRLSAMAA